MESIFRKEGIKNKIIVKPRLNWFVIENMFVRLINKL